MKDIRKNPLWLGAEIRQRNIENTTMRLFVGKRKRAERYAVTAFVSTATSLKDYV